MMGMADVAAGQLATALEGLAANPLDDEALAQADAMLLDVADALARSGVDAAETVSGQQRQDIADLRREIDQLGAGTLSERGVALHTVVKALLGRPNSCGAAANDAGANHPRLDPRSVTMLRQAVHIWLRRQHLDDCAELAQALLDSQPDLQACWLGVQRLGQPGADGQPSVSEVEMSCESMRMTKQAEVARLAAGQEHYDRSAAMLARHVGAWIASAKGCALALALARVSAADVFVVEIARDRPMRWLTSDEAAH